MKLLVIFSALFLSLPSMAANFSAFAQGRTLYVTIMGDDCNGFGGSLQVANFCKKSRMTRNYAPVCEASLLVRQTKMACRSSKPVVLELDLDEQDVATEAQTLVLDYFGKSIEVDLSN